jgi:hypothetical protein
MAGPAHPDRRIVQQTNFGVNPAAEAFLKIAAGAGRATGRESGRQPWAPIFRPDAYWKAADDRLYRRDNNFAAMRLV